MIKKKHISDLYVWIRKNNQHTPDEIVDFVRDAALEKLYEMSLVECRNCEGHGKIEDKYTYEVSNCYICKGKGKVDSNSDD